MATTPTKNPVPSESPRDLKFNAGKIDEFATSMGLTYTDRIGNKHYTIEGLRWLAQQAMSAFGYITVDSFQAGATLTLPNQVLHDTATGEYYRWDGAYPKTVPAGSTPQTTGGIGLNAWVAVGDASLRSDLKNTGGSSLVGYGSSTVKSQLDKLNAGYTIPEDYGAIGDGITDDTAALTAAITDSATNGRPLRIPPKKYIWKGPIINQDNIVIIGDKRPYINSDMTALEGGSIFIGSVQFSGKNVQIYNIGVDHGSRNFTTGGNALVISCPMQDGAFARISNCVGLGRKFDDAFHSVLVEGYTLTHIDNIIGCKNMYGLAQKSVNCNINNVTTVSCLYGIIIKSDDTYSKSDKCNLNNVVNFGNGVCERGVWVLSHSAQLQNLNISNVTSSNTQYDIVVQSLVAVNEINISNVNTQSTTQRAILLQASAPSLLYSVNINNVSSYISDDNALSMELQAGEHVSVSNFFSRIRGSTTTQNSSITIGSNVGSTNLSNITVTVDYSRDTYGGIAYNNDYKNNKISNIKASVRGIGAPRPGYAEQAAGGTGGILRVRYSESGRSFVKVTPTANAGVSTIDTVAIDGSVVPAGYMYTIQNYATSYTLTITPSGAGHIVTKSGNPIVLTGGGKAVFVFDGGSWIEV